ncbi:MAG: hypothetical protein CMH65_06980 [Nevskiales bacterium]|nr:hypothetical protein [Nevskiales bacterium]
MSDHASSSENSRSAIERRLATRRKRARAMARARARSTHIIFVLIVGAGLLMVAPRYPGILVLIAPPFAIVLAWLIGSGVWRLGPLRRAYMRRFTQPPGFWVSLLLGVALMAVPIGWWVALSLAPPDTAW